MTPLGRAFVAVVPPAPVLDAIEGRLAALTSPPLRWLPRHQWHVTLAFLGRVEDADALRAALTAALADQSPIGMRLGAGGAFPAARRASVLWVGVAHGEAAITGLADRVRDAAPTRDPAGDRPYRPHLTLARAPRPRSLTTLVDAIGVGPIGPAWTVTEVAVFESDTRPSGAVHTVRDRIPLAGA